MYVYGPIFLELVLIRSKHLYDLENPKVIIKKPSNFYVIDRSKKKKKVWYSKHLKHFTRVEEA